MEALGNALMGNTSIVSVDLRNNRISRSGTVYLSDLLRHNSTIQAVDLRWNEIGSDGAKTLATVLQTNEHIVSCELAGNKVHEDLLKFIEDLLSRNKNEAVARSARTEKELIKGMFSPMKTMPVFSSDHDHDPADGDKLRQARVLDIKTRYDAELIERERTERKLNVAEQELEQERGKNVNLREELQKALEAEKGVINYVRSIDL